MQISIVILHTGRRKRIKIIYIQYSLGDKTEVPPPKKLNARIKINSPLLNI
jgi:hypothetical protein